MSACPVTSHPSGASRWGGAWLTGWLLVLGACSVGPFRAPSQELYEPEFLQEGTEPLEADDAERPNWFVARWYDLLDVLSLRVSVGPGLGVRAVPTRYLQAGVMYRGPGEGYGELLRMPTLVAGNCQRDFGLWDVRSWERGVSVWYGYEEDVLEICDEPRPWGGGYEARSPAAIEAAAHLGIVGGEVSFDPLELGDLLLGLFGLSDVLVED